MTIIACIGRWIIITPIVGYVSESILDVLEEDIFLLEEQ